MRTPRVPVLEGGQTDPDSSRAAAAIQHASGQITRTGITFVVACAYFGIVAAATSHTDLLVGRTLAIPLLDADVPALAFFAVAPLIVILLHLNLLMVQRVYERSLRSAAIHRGLEADTLRFTALGTSLAPRALTSNVESERFVQNLLFLVFAVVNVLLPLGVLLLLQLQFLPRHSHAMIVWQRVAICIDAAAIVYFLPIILSSGGWRSWTFLLFHPREEVAPMWTKDNVVLRSLRRFAARFVVFVVPVLVVLTTLLIVHNPSEVSCTQRHVKPHWASRIDWLWREWFSYHLDLSQGSLSIPPGLRLVGRDLRCATLEGLDLHGADLRKAEISGARFDDSNLIMARLDGARTDGTENERLAPSFQSTDLRGASFRGAHLEGADLDDAEASGASFRDADLRLASLTEAVLLGSDLDRAHLEGAELDRARLSCSTADGARLDLASLRGTHLEAIQFTGDSSAVGADLREATLWESVGLKLEYQILEEAALWGVCPGPWLLTGSQIPREPAAVIDSSSLVGANFKEYSEPAWAKTVINRIERIVAVLDKNERSDDRRIERIVTRLREICRNPARRDGVGLRESSWWESDATRSLCLPPPPISAPRSSNFLGPDEANELREKFDWNVSASDPDFRSDLEDRWVHRLLVKCNDRDWMEVVLTRVFLDRYTGLDELDRRLWEYLSKRDKTSCSGLDQAVEELCEESPTAWNRAIDRFPGAADSDLRCPSRPRHRSLAWRLVSPLPL